MAAKSVAVVTGGNRGIGLAIVKGLCQKFSGNVYLTSRDVTKGKDACEALKDAGYRPKFHQLDISDQSSVNRFQCYIKTKYGGLDVLVNNAGVLHWNGPNEHLEMAEYTVRVNYFGLLRICDSLFGLLRPYARVVNMSSSTGHLSRIPGKHLRQKLSDSNLTVDQLSHLMLQFVKSAKKHQIKEDGWGSSPYAVSKIGVTALTTIQQREITKDTSRPGILINSVHPGYVDTEMTQNQGCFTVEQGAETPLYLALLPKEENRIKGSYVWFNKEIMNWTSPVSPVTPVGHLIPICN